MILIDNYDSFTYNIAQAIQTLGIQVRVIRNDQWTAEEVLETEPSALIIGPGPGRPQDAGISKELIEKAAVPLLGICLGHQALGEVFGGRIVRAGRVMHGKRSPIFHNGEGLFEGVSTPFYATRYHSLILQALPEELVLSAWTQAGEIMGVRHKTRPLFGVQFHPESIASEEGGRILRNFCAYTNPRK